MKDYKLMMIEDDQVFRWLQSKLIQKSELHHTPVSFENGEVAINYLNNSYTQETSFLILLDINMPVMNGWKFLEQIQQKPYANLIKVVMLTSSVEDSDKECAKQYPQVVGFYEKPLTLQICNEIKAFV